MEHKINDFPQYRRLKNGKAFYRIVNNLHFTEVQLIGEKRIKHEVKAKQYPEKLRIIDMLAAEDPFELCSSEEFDHQLSFVL